MLVNAQITDPATISAREMMSTRRLPNISPNGPAMGVTTAPASNVAVMTQEASEAVVFSSVGNCGISGTTSVCIKEITMPTNARIVTAARG